METHLTRPLQRSWRILAICIVWIGSAAAYLAIPSTPDQFVFDYIGWRLVEGDVPYRDFIDMNWPGPYWLHALSVGMFGVRLWSWHALDFALFGLATCATIRIVARTSSDEARGFVWFIAPLAYVALAFPPVSGQQDASGAQALACAAWCHLRAIETQRARWQFALGVLVAAAVANKPTLIVAAPLVVVHGLVFSRHRRRYLQQLSGAVAGGIAGSVIALGLLHWQGATLREAFEAAITYNVWTQYDHSRTAYQLIVKWFRIHGMWALLTFPAAVGFSTLAFRSWRNPAASALAGLAMVATVSFFIQRTGAMYHLAPCVLPYVAAAGIGLARVLEVFQCRTRSPARWAGAAIVAAGVSVIGGRYPGVFQAPINGPTTDFLSRFTSHDGITAADAVSLAAFARRRTAPHETVLVAGRTGSINYLARRKQPSRFIYLPVLMAARPPLPMSDRWNDIFRNELSASPPALCIVTSWARANWLDRDSESARFFRRLLATRYQRAREPGPLGGVEIYALRADGS